MGARLRRAVVVGEGVVATSRPGRSRTGWPVLPYAAVRFRVDPLPLREPPRVPPGCGGRASQAAVRGEATTQGGGVTEWKPDLALGVLEELEAQIEPLRDAVRGSDSVLVSLKLTTLENCLSLLRSYLVEAAT